MKILLLDIETAPNLAYVWGMWQQNISMDKIVAKGHVLCWSAKWYGESETMFSSVRDGEKTMLKRIHKLLDKADVVIHYNGRSFDIPTLNKEFVTHGMTPPAPYKQVDLLTVVRDQFRFPINKLDYVAQTLGLGGKVRHPGFQMWVDCMAGDDAAWAKMEKYNRGDVILLEKLYDKLKPWVKNHPHHGAFDGRPTVCPNCGEEHTLQRRGSAVTRDVRYPRFQCVGPTGCGAWSRGKKALSKTRTTLQGI
ncbi:MAG TPA: ribonuclease H-like domain-containing protein [Baekduia sp.]|nr:ribonuclease H-like domain-containing protein [Baekduia sp.]